MIKETPDKALIRELKEEVDAIVLDYNLLDVTSNNIKWEMSDNLFEDLHHIGILYEVNITSKPIRKTPDGLDSNGANWYLIKDLKKEDLTPFAIYSLQKLGYKFS